MNIGDKILNLVNDYDNKDRVINDGRVTRAGKILTKPFACSICGKGFKPDNGHVKLFYRKAGQIDFVCPSCYEKHLDNWTVVDCKEIVPGQYNMGGIANGCKMKDGTIRDICYGQSVSNIGDVPEIFNETLKPFIEKHNAEVAKRGCSDIQVIDTWDENKIVVTFCDGSKYELAYKMTVNNGLQYKPDDLSKLSKEQIDGVNLYMTNKGLQKFYITA